MKMILFLFTALIIHDSPFSSFHRIVSPTLKNLETVNWNVVRLVLLLLLLVVRVVSLLVPQESVQEWVVVGSLLVLEPVTPVVRHLLLLLVDVPAEDLVGHALVGLVFQRHPVRVVQTLLLLLDEFVLLLLLLVTPALLVLLVAGVPHDAVVFSLLLLGVDVFVLLAVGAQVLLPVVVLRDVLLLVVQLLLLLVLRLVLLEESAPEWVSDKVVVVLLLGVDVTRRASVFRVILVELLLFAFALLLQELLLLVVSGGLGLNDDFLVLVGWVDI